MISTSPRLYNSHVKSIPSFRFKNVGIYLFGIIILYLAAAYFGGFFLALLYVFVSFPLLTMLLTFAAHFYLDFDLQFDIDRPVKGQILRYHFNIINKSIIPIARLYARIKTLRADINHFSDEISCYLKARSRLRKTFTLRFDFRGIYKIGLEQITIEDPFGFFTLTLPVTFRMVYIYPRINYLTAFQQTTDGNQSTGVGLSPLAGEADHTLFTQLSEYRDGQSTRHIYWKKFMNLGIPFLKEFDRTSNTSFRIYLDTRRNGYDARQSLFIEDTSIEILVCLVKYFLNRDLPVSVSAAGTGIYRYTGSHSSQFDTFYKSTLDLNFEETLSPAALFSADRTQLSLDNSVLVLITHIVDKSIVSLTEELIRDKRDTILIVNLASLTDPEMERHRARLSSYSTRGGRLLFVRNAETIVEDLSGRINEYH